MHNDIYNTTEKTEEKNNNNKAQRVSAFQAQMNGDHRYLKGSNFPLSVHSQQNM